MKYAALLLFLSFLMPICADATAESELLAVRAGRIMTMAGPDLAGGVILIRAGRITAINPGRDIPPQARLLDFPEGWVMPGMVLAHSYLGLLGDDRSRENEELSGPDVAQVRVIDAFNPFARSIVQARRAGVTSALVAPGRGAVIGGQAAVFKLLGSTVEEMLLSAPTALKMSLGQGPKEAFGSKGRLPSTRMGSASIVRQALLDARAYLEPGSKTRPPRDLRLEALAAALQKKLPVFIEAYRADDIMTALRLADEFGLSIVLVGAVEAYRVVDEISRRGIPVLLGPVGINPKRLETERINAANAAILHAAGIRVALFPESGYGLGALEELPLLAALAVKEGLPADAALRAITWNPALILGLEKRIGSIEPGKDADLAVFDGDPLAYRTRVLKVLVGGREID